MNDLISRHAAIERMEEHRRIFCRHHMEFTILSDKDKARVDEIDNCIATLINLPSTQPEISRIEQELHGKTPEEQYEFLYWLLLKFALTYTDSRLAVIEWLRGEKES